MTTDQSEKNTAPINRIKPTPYRRAVSWCRIGSAFLFNYLLFSWIFTKVSPYHQLKAWLELVLREFQIESVDRVLSVLLIVWYVFLCQLKIRWAFWLPFYFILIIPWKAFTLLFAAVWARIEPYVQTATLTGKESISQAPARTQRRRPPIKRLWLVLFFIWFIAFRTLELPWAAWIPPILLIPIWITCLRSAYRCAMSPPTFARGLVTVCTSQLETLIRNLQKPRSQGDESPRYVLGFADWVIRRYSQDKVLAVVQREALTLFSIALLVAIASSICFWGLFGSALYRNSPHAFSNYEYFSSQSSVESMLWAWGCMTTSIEFPTTNTPLTVRLLHAAVLATGLFQLTFLFACFSTMAGAEGPLVVESVQLELEKSRKKYGEAKELESKVIDVLAESQGPENAAEKPGSAMSEVPEKTE